MDGIPASRLKASELIEKLQALIKKHGDQPVWISGYDYPEPVIEVRHNTQESDGYTPHGVFVLR